MLVWGLLAVALVVGLTALLWHLTTVKKTDEVVIVSSSQRGSVKSPFTEPIPRSFNQPEGIVFTYSGWVLINDFTVGYGKKRTILDKDGAPRISIDSTSNSLIFGVKTYGSEETVLVPNIPAAKWIHFAMVVNQQAVDVYINGTLRQHHTLGQLPDQNEAPVITGSNWDGVVARVSYWPRAISSAEIQAQASQPPPDSLQPRVGSGQYFDIGWYIGRLNSA
jgi:hypothetical protein